MYPENLTLWFAKAYKVPVIRLVCTLVSRHSVRTLVMEACEHSFQKCVLSGKQEVGIGPLPLCFWLIIGTPSISRVVKLHHYWFGCLYFGAWAESTVIHWLFSSIMCVCVCVSNNMLGPSLGARDREMKPAWFLHLWGTWEWKAYGGGKKNGTDEVVLVPSFNKVWKSTLLLLTTIYWTFTVC